MISILLYSHDPLRSALVGGLGALICFALYWVIVYGTALLKYLFFAPKKKSDDDMSVKDDNILQKDDFHKESNALQENFVSTETIISKENVASAENNVLQEDNHGNKNVEKRHKIGALYIVVWGLLMLVSLTNIILNIYSSDYTNNDMPFGGLVIVLFVAILLVISDYSVIKSIRKVKRIWKSILHYVILTAMGIGVIVSLTYTFDVAPELDTVHLRRMFLSDDLKEKEQAFKEYGDQYYKKYRYDYYLSRAIESLSEAGNAKAQAYYGDNFYVSSYGAYRWCDNDVFDGTIITPDQGALYLHPLDCDSWHTSSRKYLRIELEESLVDLNRAFYWWKKSAEAGDARGLYRMGCCYAHIYQIKQVEKDFVKAYAYWKEAASKGYGMAYKRLGDLFGTWEYMDAYEYSRTNPSDSNLCRIYGIKLKKSEDSDGFKIKESFLLPKEWCHDVKQARIYWQKAVECGDEAKESAEIALQKVYPEEL